MVQRQRLREFRFTRRLHVAEILSYNSSRRLTTRWCAECAIYECAIYALFNKNSLPLPLPLSLSLSLSLSLVLSRLHRCPRSGEGTAVLLVSVYLSHHNPKLKKEIFFLSYSNVSITFRAHDVVLEPVIESKKSEVNVAELENGRAWVGPNLLPVYLFSAWTSETIRMQPRTGHKLLRHNLFLILSPGLITNYKLCTCLKFYWC